MMVATQSVGFVSCGSDDDDEQVENPEDNLPDSSKSFVGYWRNSQANLVSSCDFAFFADGTCDRYKSYDGYLVDEGYWTFNDLSKVLATTVGEWQWEVTLSNSETWAGISLGSAKTQTFIRDDSRYALAYLYSTKWICDSLAISFGGANMGQESISFVGDEFHTSSNLRMWISDASVSNSTITANYAIKESYYTKVSHLLESPLNTGISKRDIVRNALCMGI